MNGLTFFYKDDLEATNWRFFSKKRSIKPDLMIRVSLKKSGRDLKTDFSVSYQPSPEHQNGSKMVEEQLFKEVEDLDLNELDKMLDDSRTTNKKPNGFLKENSKKMNGREKTQLASGAMEEETSKQHQVKIPNRQLKKLAKISNAMEDDFDQLLQELRVGECQKIRKDAMDRCKTLVRDAKELKKAVPNESRPRISINGEPALPGILSKKSFLRKKKEDLDFFKDSFATNKPAKKVPKMDIESDFSTLLDDLDLDKEPLNKTFVSQRKVIDRGSLDRSVQSMPNSSKTNTSGGTVAMKSRLIDTGNIIPSDLDSDAETILAEPEKKKVRFHQGGDEQFEFDAEYGNNLDIPQTDNVSRSTNSKMLSRQASKHNKEYSDANNMAFVHSPHITEMNSKASPEGSRLLRGLSMSEMDEISVINFDGDNRLDEKNGNEQSQISFSRRNRRRKTPLFKEDLGSKVDQLAPIAEEDENSQEEDCISQSHHSHTSKCSHNSSSSKKSNKKRLRKLIQDKRGDRRKKSLNTQINGSVLDKSVTPVKTVPKKKPEPEEEISCCICYTDEIEEYGVLDCKHSFCFSCIKDWANVTNNCPLCKTEFMNITQKDKNRNFIATIMVERRRINLDDAQGLDEVEQDLADAEDYCYACGSTYLPDYMLVCEHCFVRCCHIYCLLPEIHVIPEENWYCDFCVTAFNIRTTLPIANIIDAAERHTRPVMPGIENTPIIRRNNNRNPNVMANVGNVDLYQMEDPRISPIRQRGGLRRGGRQRMTHAQRQERRRQNIANGSIRVPNTQNDNLGGFIAQDEEADIPEFGAPAGRGRRRGRASRNGGRGLANLNEGTRGRNSSRGLQSLIDCSPDQSVNNDYVNALERDNSYDYDDGFIVASDNSGGSHVSEDREFNPERDFSSDGDDIEDEELVEEEEDFIPNRHQSRVSGPRQRYRAGGGNRRSTTNTSNRERPRRRANTRDRVALDSRRGNINGGLFSIMDRLQRTEEGNQDGHDDQNAHANAYNGRVMLSRNRRAGNPFEGANFRNRPTRTISNQQNTPSRQTHAPVTRFIGTPEQHPAQETTNLTKDDDTGENFF